MTIIFLGAGDYLTPLKSICITCSAPTFFQDKFGGQNSIVAV